MTPFTGITGINVNTVLQPSFAIPAPAAAPLPRFVDEPLRWISVANGAIVSSFARCSLRTFQGNSVAVPGLPASQWTLVELSPLPAFAAQTLLNLKGGLPVMFVLIYPQATLSASLGPGAALGELIATSATSATPSVWFGIGFQDRIVRDPALWSSEIRDAITAAGADVSAWAMFADRLLNIESPARPIYIVDHIGRPVASGQSFTITTNAGSTTVTPVDGRTNVVLPAGGPVTIAFNSASDPLIAGVQSAGGAFEAAYQLPAGERYIQATDANRWFAPRDPGITSPLSRWIPDSFLEGIPDGNPYFARLVDDMRKIVNGGIGLAGWAFVKESLLDETLPWPLIPGDDTTRFKNLVQALHDLPTKPKVRLLVNQFLQVENNTFDDATAVLAVLWGLFALNFPLNAWGVLTTDTAGFGVLMGFMAAAEFLIDTEFTIDVVRAIAESSTTMVDDLNSISADIAKWSPYPAATLDNPLFTPPLKVVGVTVDDVIRFGVYHQKFVVGQTDAGKYFGYVGGIDINSDRVDSPLHRAVFPYHDVQARLTGPALQDLIQSFTERCVAQGVDVPFEVPATPPSIEDGKAGHLVQIARTYYKPKTGNGLSFAPAGETQIHRTNMNALAQAQDFIYIEEQYFTPDAEYLHALAAAAGHAKSLIITCCMETGQLYGPIRRTEVFQTLRNAWGDRVKIGALIRRHLNPTPAATVNLGRCTLMEAIDGSSLAIKVGPRAHVPAPPFWVFVNNELMQVLTAAPDTGPTQITLNVARGPVGSRSAWGSKVDSRDKDSPVMCVNVPHIYVHAKLMIVDDVFLSIGSANMNRRGHFHDGEINAMAMPQHLKRDPDNPARRLRCELWGEHLGLTPEMGISLLADPLSALSYFDRPWLAGNRWQPLEWSGALEDAEVGLSFGDSIGSVLMGVAIGGLEHLDQSTFWPVLVDPTSFSDPNPNSPGPHEP